MEYSFKILINNVENYGRKNVLVLLFNDNYTIFFENYAIP